MSVPSRFDELGGEPVLRMLIGRFVDRMFADPMIGFMFRNADRQRIKDKEYELAAAHLGADVVYSGRPLGEAHRKHLIMGGQFDRRLELLRSVLVEAGVAEPIVRHWLAHTEKLRSTVTADPSGVCSPDPDPSSKP